MKNSKYNLFNKEFDHSLFFLKGLTNLTEGFCN
ncbi:hypothetical protein NIASO_03065 [Niabella soli DSM 19437]|uniref:Uncharacterized protein n=1 Tax=Niabella soli DSM 19437 TaxID=929713 RepID=W0F6X2_9BACT|nr:hypothetical protein NIASO_03065 [Niabella soli DSM 19437]